MSLTPSSLEDVQIAVFENGKELFNVSRNFTEEFSSRSLFRPNPTFRVILPKNVPIDVVIGMKSIYEIKAHLRVSGTVSFNQANSIELIFYGIFLGILLGLVLYNSVLFAFTKEPLYLDFALFAFCLSLYCFFARGLGIVFDPLLRSQTTPLITLSLVIMAFGRFCMRLFAEAPVARPSLRLGFLALQLLAFGVAIATIFRFGDLIILSQMNGLLSLLSLLLFCVFSVRTQPRWSLASILPIGAGFLLWSSRVFTPSTLLKLSDHVFLALQMSDLLLISSVLMMALLVALQIRTNHFARIEAESKASSNDRLKHFIQILCHDLANPLTRIIALAERAKRKNDSADSAKLLKAAYQQRAIIEHVRHKQFDRSVQHLSVQPVLVTDALQDSQFILSGQLSQKELKLEIQILPLDLRVQADPIILKHTIISNVLSNAIKFSHPGSTIHFSAFAESSDWVCLQIRDHGTGISTSQRQKLLDSSTNPSLPGTDGEPGSGIGLNLVKAMLEAQGGRLEIHSPKAAAGSPKEADGTIVSIWLPRAKPDCKAAQLPL